MKKIFYLLMTMLAFSACSSDDPEWMNSGNTGGGNSGNTSDGSTITNPAKRNPIPADQLSGKWVFDKNSYIIEADDAETRKKIEDDLLYGSSDDIYPRVGLMRFYPKESVLIIPGMNPEGSMRWNYKNLSENLELFGDYFSSNDTIYYYHWTLKNKYDYMVKKGNRLHYHFTDTQHFKNKFPKGGVKKVIYYAEYARIIE